MHFSVFFCLFSVFPFLPLVVPGLIVDLRASSNQASSLIFGPHWTIGLIVHLHDDDDDDDDKDDDNDDDDDDDTDDNNDDEAM